MKAINSIVYILLLNLLPVVSYTQNIHMFLVADSNDPVIGDACRIDNFKMLAELQTIADVIGHNLNRINITGNSFTAENLSNAIKSINPDPSDIVFFYYSGHGYNDFQTDSKWPILKLSNGFFPLDEVYKSLVNKQARFSIIMADCCNNFEQSNVEITTEIIPIQDVKPMQQNNYNNLFLEAHENILISSSKRGQVSYTHPTKGSYFTAKFIEALGYAINYSEKISWHELLLDVKNRLSSESFPMGPQIPQFAILKEQRLPRPSPKPPVIEPVNYTHESVNPVSYSSMNEFLNILVNHDISNERRRQTMNTKDQIFDNDAFAEIYKGHHFLEPQKIEDFLIRLYLNAQLIDRVNFIENKSEKNNAGQYRKIAVQELWK